MADNQPQGYVPRSHLWKHLIIEDNQLKCRYCNQKWDRAVHSPSTSTIRLYMFKRHRQEVYPNNKTFVSYLNNIVNLNDFFAFSITLLDRKQFTFMNVKKKLLVT